MGFLNFREGKGVRNLFEALVDGAAMEVLCPCKNFSVDGRKPYNPNQG
jgi:hypothetical protein